MGANIGGTGPAVPGSPARGAGTRGVLAASAGYARRPATWRRTGPTVLAVAVRLAVGRFRPGDAVAVAAAVAVYGPLEWVAHHNGLHGLAWGPLPARPDAVEVRSHLAHHDDPAELERLFVPLQHVPPGLLAVALVGAAVSSRFPRVLTFAATELVLMSGHYWIHYLMHAPVEVRNGWFRAIRANHLSHHAEESERWRMGVLFMTTDRVVAATRCSRSGRSG